MEPHYFIAIQLPKQLREQVALVKKEQLLSFDRYVHKEDIHVTLVFLGKCTDGQLALVIQSLRDLAQNFRPFPLQIETFGTFGRKESPRIFWLGVEKEPMLYTYRADIFKQMEKLGFRLDKRSFSPHITIARKWTGPNQYKPMKTEMTGSRWQVNEIVLYESHVNNVPKYKIVERFQFKQ